MNIAISQPKTQSPIVEEIALMRKQAKMERAKTARQSEKLLKASQKLEVRIKENNFHINITNAIKTGN